MLYDAFGRPIRKQHLYGFARVPRCEPSRLDPGYSESGCADAIGFAELGTEEPDESEELLEVKCESLPEVP